MNARQRDGLAEIGVTTKKYCLEGVYGDDGSAFVAWEIPDPDRPDGRFAANWAVVPVWGLSLMKDGEEVAVIESTVPEIDRRFHLRLARRGIDVGVFKTQREAIAGWIRREYRIAS